MQKVRLTMAVDRHDHVIDIVRGKIEAPGLELVPLELPLEEMLQRFATWREWDISEFSTGNLVARVADGDDSIVGIPVFPSRVFRHSAIYVRDDQTVRQPGDLEGRRVGVPEWAQTAGIYARGVLAHEYGVHLDRVEWVQAGVNQPGRTEHVGLHLPAGITVTPRPESALNDLLQAGEIDAIITARPPRDFRPEGGRITRLIRDHRTVERDYAAKTGVFPIMHVIVVKGEVAAQYPWALPSIYQAFEEARTRSLTRLQEGASSATLLPWHAEQVADLQAVFATRGEEYWPYGIAKNRPTLDAFLQFCFEQGVGGRKLSVEELFPPIFLGEVRV